VSSYNDKYPHFSARHIKVILVHSLVSEVFIARWLKKVYRWLMRGHSGGTVTVTGGLMHGHGVS
jgi:hypothetical protein